MGAEEVLAAGVRVVRATPEHVAALPAIEVAAAALFSPDDVPAELASDPTPLADLAAAQRAGRLWVALGPGDAPIGFALLGEKDGEAHLVEIDVHPDHGRRGVGKALLRAVFAAAAGDAHRAVTLTTFAHVPWNAPFYARMGFRVLAPTELTPALRATLAGEAARGLDPAKRVAMRRELP
jgi:GNAT superfamily N-acetyltransferase